MYSQVVDLNEMLFIDRDLMAKEDNWVLMVKMELRDHLDQL